MGLFYSKTATVSPANLSYSFHGQEDHDVNHPIYHMIVQDDLQYFEVLSARYQGTSIEQWMPQYNDDVLKHWSGWSFSIKPKKAKISLKLLRNGAKCKFTEIPFLTSKLNEDLEMDYTFLLECVTLILKKTYEEADIVIGTEPGTFNDLVRTHYLEPLVDLKNSLDTYLSKKPPGGSKPLKTLVNKLKTCIDVDKDVQSLRSKIQYHPESLLDF